MQINKCEKCGHLSIDQHRCPVCGTQIKYQRGEKLKRTSILVLFYALSVILAAITLFCPVLLKQGRNIFVYRTLDGEKVSFNENKVILDINVAGDRVALFKRTFHNLEEEKEALHSISGFSANKYYYYGSGEFPHNFDFLSLQGDTNGGNAVVINGLLKCGCATTVIRPDVDEIGEYAFYMCDSLRRAIIPCTVKSVSSFSYEKCDNLEYVEINGNTFIEQHAFRYCSKLNKIIIKGDATIGEEAFWGCTNLHTVLMAKNATVTLRDQSFAACPNLTMIVFPESFEYLGDLCINNTKYIVYPASSPRDGQNLPYPKNGSVIVPRGSKKNYQETYMKLSQSKYVRIQEVPNEIMNQILSGNYNFDQGVEVGVDSEVLESACAAFSFIPDHDCVRTEASQYMTEDLYGTLYAAWDVPRWVDGIGAEEFLFYFLTGNGGSFVNGIVSCEPAYLSEDSCTVTIDYVETFDGDSSLQEIRSISLSMIKSDGKWLLDDFGDQIKSTCKVYIKSEVENFLSGYTIGYMKDNQDGESYSDDKISIVERFFRKYIKEYREYLENNFDDIRLETEH